ncbi:HAD hydrolase, family IIID [Aphanomyces invadans]|uniref:protein-serine/threonine phosphatase n=1 Tax=Aphanomyces invadans TaxID=157072 RepID=A0A024TFK6_9STRA|nr:HAD hydrolase, family IIID [Aphanomyces invadans]ETV92910.1 HAD hydrolase, family IIID [Aphanomyces invadans]|eukprot:XP_008878431.1 HAD hydrolase, family IIID [Aphanomyces invadans]
MLTFVGKWKKVDVEVTLSRDATVLELKKEIHARTRVLPHRQKLVGINHKGKPAEDHVPLRELVLKTPVHKFMLIGTVEDDIFVDPSSVPKETLPSVFADFGCAFSPGSAEWYKAKAINDLVDQFAAQIELIHPFRPGKKLLVLDLDHTLMDISATKTTNGIPMTRFRRPYLHEFLTLVYQHYDIGIWSQTSWTWIEIKLTELGMLTSPDYCINFILDKTRMFAMPTSDRFKTKPTKVKALPIIWRAFPNLWHAKNTLHIDDLVHNFALNPRNGIVISPYDCMQAHAADDQELAYLARYLIQVCAGLDDVSLVSHDNWASHRAT